MGDKPQRLPQYIAAIGATMGGFSLGTVIGWFSPAEKMVSEILKMPAKDISWVSSIMPLGAAASQIYMALTLDLLGRKLSMLAISIPFVIGWLIILTSKSMAQFCIGRFITGFCGGSFCVAAPAYIGEIADKDIRGGLSVLFQLLLVIGILLSYVLGEFGNLFALTVPLCLGPVALFVILLFLPESPVFLVKKGKSEKARTALQFFRGKNYNIDSEMKEIEEYSKEEASDNFWQKFKTRACIKAFIMLLGMHIVQQLSGINAFMFYAHSIFEEAGSSMSPGTNAIILALVQVVLTTVSASMVDKAGRKLLWIVSLGVMGLCLVVMGFYYMTKRFNPDSAKAISWLPLLVICIYLAGFSLGTGPLPWVMLSEFLPNSVKGPLGSFSTCFNWLLAFAITMTFKEAVDVFGADIVFWAYAVVCGLGLAFVVLFVIETKNKTLEEIQTELGAPPST